MIHIWSRHTELDLYKIDQAASSRTQQASDRRETFKLTKISTDEMKPLNVESVKKIC